jgi:glycosyltransferase involved in cell wall biosynthesis
VHCVWIAPEWPWPPRGGAQLRTGGLLTALVRGGARVTLVGPVEGAPPQLEAPCEAVEGLRTGHHRRTRWRNVLTGRPLDTCLPAPGLRSLDWRDVDVVVATQPFLAPVLARVPSAIPVVLDAHNVESEVAQARVRASTGPRRWLAALDRGRIATAEQRAVNAAALVIAPSDRDAALLGGGTVVVPSGSEPSREPRPRGAGSLGLMVGHLAYAPNHDGVMWLLDEVLPYVLREEPAFRVLVAGRAPAEALVRRCRTEPAAELAPDPVDLDPLYERAAMALVPIRMGSGTRLKVLEAVRLGVPVVSTAKGAEGLPAELVEHLLVADSPGAFARAVLTLLRDRDEGERRARAAATALDRLLTWDRIGAQLSEHLHAVVEGPR